MIWYYIVLVTLRFVLSRRVTLNYLIRVIMYWVNKPTDFSYYLYEYRAWPGLIGAKRLDQGWFLVYSLWLNSGRWWSTIQNKGKWWNKCSQTSLYRGVGTQSGEEKPGIVWFVSKCCSYCDGNMYSNRHKMRHELWYITFLAQNEQINGKFGEKEEARYIEVHVIIDL